MAGFNKAILVGNLGADPQIRTIESGAKVASFSIATTETYLDKDNNRQEKTEWHRIVASNMVLMSAPQGGGSYNNIPPPAEEYSRPVNNPNTYVGTNPTTHTTSQKIESPGNDVVINDPTDDLPF